MSSILPINNDAIHLLSSAQVITSVHAVVKELVENSLDAKATNIEVKLERYGLDLIEVKDNGTGIKREDVPYMAMPHFTSKLHEFDDIHSLLTYGFRGEALTSIAAVSDVSITTCTEQDEVALTYTINHAGQVVGTKPGHASQGTVVSTRNLFQNIPVRKQCYKSNKRCKEDFKKVEDLLLAFGIAHPGVRFGLKHNRSIVWQKVQTTDPKTNLILIFGSSIHQQLSPINYQCFNPMVKINAYLPKPNANDISLVSRSTSDRMFVLVNQRPIDIKPVIKLVRSLYLEAFPSQSGRFPLAVVMIHVPPSDFDVNLDPNKTQILLHHHEFILTTLESLITQFYGPSKLPQQQGSSTSENKRSTSQQTSSTKQKDSSSPKKDTLAKNASGEDTCLLEDPHSSHCPVDVDDRSPDETSNGVCCVGDQSSPATAAAIEDKPGKDDEERMEEFELLDISEFEQDFNDDDVLDTAADHNTVQHQTTATCTREIENDSHSTSSVSPLIQVTLSQWSRGEILNKDMEPVKILQPKSTTIHSTPTPKQSKLDNRGPSPIFDMINYKPVKRKADSTPGQLEPSKRQKQLPALLEKLVHNPKGQLNVVEDVAPTTVLHVELEKIASRISTVQSTSSSPRSKDFATVIGYCDPPGVWLIQLEDCITYFHRTSTTGVAATLSSKDGDLEFIKDILSGSSRDSQEDFKCYFHHLCNI